MIRAIKNPDYPGQNQYNCERCMFSWKHKVTLTYCPACKSPRWNEPVSVVDKDYKCRHCGHEWTDWKRRKRCPNCHEPHWEETAPEVFYEHKCLACGHEWANKKEQPVVCRRCRSPRWNEEPVQPARRGSSVEDRLAAVEASIARILALLEGRQPQD